MKEEKESQKEMLTEKKTFSQANMHTHVHSHTQNDLKVLIHIEFVVLKTYTLQSSTKGMSQALTIQ